MLGRFIYSEYCQVDACFELMNGLGIAEMDPGG